MEEQLINKVKSFIDNGSLIDESKSVLVALSGGADSVALLRVLLELGYNCRAAHCNFHLRGDESNRDERFVTELCQKLGVPLDVKHFDVPAYMTEHGVSMEMACRELRYAWFDELRQEYDCDCIAVAHHNDDNVETFFLNALRGTGIAGLTGMKPRNGAVVRPLLCVSRAEILEWLGEIGQKYVTDSTNLENDAKRNRLRNIVLPAIYEEFDGAKDALLTTIDNMRHCNELYRESVGVMRNIVSDRDGDSLVIDLEILNSFDNRQMLLYEILKPLGFNREQCADMLTSAVGRHFISPSHKVTINRVTIDVLPQHSRDENVYVVNLENDAILEPIDLEISHVENKPFSPSLVDGKNSVAFNNEISQCSEVLLRHWREGDRFRPFGMNGSKLISDLFTDLKLSEKEKNETWLLEADGEILWVIGCRAAQAFKVPKDATNYLVISIKNSDN
ncbi:MAG: tRNA lysidine(34) synthetase TilS [Muribaculaceae bacterium]|nr:tRNA lysidine(34) synthetase TilS [Muribaculaceae bacterium]